VLHAVALGANGDATRAVPAVEAAVAQDPSLAIARFMAGTVLIYAGEYERAISELEEARRLAPEILPVVGALGHAYGRAGRPDEARAQLSSLRRRPVTDAVLPAIAKVHLALGNVDAALGALLEAADAHDSFFASEPIASPMFAELRAHPRFGELLVKLNLAESPLATLSRPSPRP
jgi:lipopolysaccharide biosynthesis regulator YciM